MDVGSHALHTGVADASSSRGSRLSGIGAAVLVVAGAVVMDQYEYLPSGDRLAAFFETGSTRITVASYMGLIAAFLLLWFAAELRARLRGAEGGTGRFSALSFGGGVAAASAMVAAYCTLLAAAQRGGGATGIGADTAVAMYDLYGQLLGTGAAIGFAAMIGAVAVVSFRRSVLPRWANWVSAVIAAGLLFLGWVFMPAALLWIVGVGLALFGEQPPAGR